MDQGDRRTIGRRCDGASPRPTIRSTCGRWPTSASAQLQRRSRAAREVGDRALHLARRIGDDELVVHALRGQLWRRVTLERAPALLAPTRELMELATRSGDLELVVPAAFFRSLFGYMRGLPFE